ncbi:conserved hypothetical protein [Vibrio parahaemolyticus]
MQGRISVILVSRRVVLSNFALKKNHKKQFIYYFSVSYSDNDIDKTQLAVCDSLSNSVIQTKYPHDSFSRRLDNDTEIEFSSIRTS